jgi:cyclohexadienyl dehydratase
MGGVSVTLERQKIGFFSEPYLRDGKTPIARCADQQRYQALSEIDRPDVRVIVNPGGTNEASGGGDVMITDASEARLQAKLHPGVLCAIHPDRPFDFAEKAYWMPPDPALKAFVDQWLHMAIEDGDFDRLAAKWLR